jgi:hypothetical protein
MNILSEDVFLSVSRYENDKPQFFIPFLRVFNATKLQEDLIELREVYDTIFFIEDHKDYDILVFGLCSEPKTISKLSNQF